MLFPLIIFSFCLFCLFIAFLHVSFYLSSSFFPSTISPPLLLWSSLVPPTLFIDEDHLVSRCQAFVQIHHNTFLIFYVCHHPFSHFFSSSQRFVWLIRKIDSAPLRKLEREQSFCQQHCWIWLFRKGNGSCTSRLKEDDDLWSPWQRHCSYSTVIFCPIVKWQKQMYFLCSEYRLNYQKIMSVLGSSWKLMLSLCITTVPV